TVEGSAAENGAGGFKTVLRSFPSALETFTGLPPHFQKRRQILIRAHEQDEFVGSTPLRRAPPQSHLRRPRQPDDLAGRCLGQTCRQSAVLEPVDQQALAVRRPFSQDMAASLRLLKQRP